MNKQQKQIDEFFARESWPYWSPHEILACMTEEVGELARVINIDFGPKNYKANETRESLEAELGDVLYTLACLANTQGIDLDEALQRSIDKMTTRDPGRYPKEN